MALPSVVNTRSMMPAISTARDSPRRFDFHHKAASLKAEATDEELLNGKEHSE